MVILNQPPLRPRPYDTQQVNPNGGSFDPYDFNDGRFGVRSSEMFVPEPPLVSYNIPEPIELPKLEPIEFPDPIVPISTGPTLAERLRESLDCKPIWER